MAPATLGDSQIMAPMSEKPARRSISGYLIALPVVAASTLVAEIIYRLFDTNRLSMVFLAGVLVTAVRFGSGPAYLTALIAVAVYNFYLVEPRFTLEFGTPEDIINLVVFLAVAMLTGRLAGRIQDEKRSAETRARTTSALLAASREFSSSAAEKQLRERIAHHVAAAARGPAFAWDNATTPPPAQAGIPPTVINEAASAPTGQTIHLEGWCVRRLAADAQGLGIVAWRFGDDARADAEAGLVNVLIDLGAAAIARARLVEAQAEMAAVARTEQLRNALLSSISHDLRTPLASILASVSSLREFGDQFPPETRDDLLLTIQDETERLNTFVSNLLNMTRLEGGGLVIESAPFNVVETVQRAVTRQARRSTTKQVRVHSAPRDLVGYGDAVLFEQAFANVLENAVRFTSAGGAVSVNVEILEGLIILDVTDEGPGVRPEELEAIFGKFYRAEGADVKLQGAGLGLSIVKGFVEAMGGAVSARLVDGREGLTVSLMIPRYS